MQISEALLSGLGDSVYEQTVQDRCKHGATIPRMCNLTALRMRLQSSKFCDRI